MSPGHVLILLAALAIVLGVFMLFSEDKADEKTPAPPAEPPETDFQPTQPDDGGAQTQDSGGGPRPTTPR